MALQPATILGDWPASFMYAMRTPSLTFSISASARAFTATRAARPLALFAAILEDFDGCRFGRRIVSCVVGLRLEWASAAPNQGA